MLRANVNEMNVEAINLGEEVRHSVDLRLALPPIMLTRPVMRELLNGCELDALRCIRDLFAIGPLCCGYAPAQVGKVRSCGLEMKRTNRGILTHVCILLPSLSVFYSYNHRYTPPP